MRRTFIFVMALLGLIGQLGAEPVRAADPIEPPIYLRNYTDAQILELQPIDPQSQTQPRLACNGPWRLSLFVRLAAVPPQLPGTGRAILQEVREGPRESIFDQQVNAAIGLGFLIETGLLDMAIAQAVPAGWMISKDFLITNWPTCAEAVAERERRGL